MQKKKSIKEIKKYCLKKAIMLNRLRRVIVGRAFAALGLVNYSFGWLSLIL